VTSVRPASFREILQVSQERIARLSDIDLNLLVADLLRTHAYSCGADVSKVTVNTETKAADEGCDGWSPKPPEADPWFGSAETCWQFKAGHAGQPSRLRNEVTKGVPSKTLSAGGRFFVIASGSTSGASGEQERLAAIRSEAQTANLPTSAIDVIGSERLTNWVNQYPSVAAAWANRPSGLWRLDDWSKLQQHNVPWQASPEIQRILERLGADLDFSSGSLHHLHVQGPPGVGKTRFAMEICKGAAWGRSVIYFGNASDFRLTEIIDAAVSEPDVQLMVVADEVPASQLMLLRDSIERGNGRVRLITIGPSDTPDPSRIPAHLVAPLDRLQMSAVLRAWHPAMPLEQIDFVTEFADGYIRLAKLAGDAIARDPTTDVRALLDLNSIRTVLDRMLGKRSRRPLHVIAALSSVGWTDEVQPEGEAIARHFSLDWNDVRMEVERFHREYGIAPRGGRYRYISPKPLAIYLAVEAWKTYPDLLKSLPGVLPSEAAIDAYYERLEMLASNPQAREFARSELEFFFQLDDFIKPGAMRRWAALSPADPALAAKRLASALATVPIQDRREIPERDRRTAVWTLVRLAWRKIAFHDAATALALLAAAETETWANNSTGEFVNRFKVFLGGTALPYFDRLLVIDELTAQDDHAMLRLAIKALARVGEIHSTRTNSAGLGDGPREPEWRPTTGAEHGACVKQALERLTRIAALGVAEVQDELVAAAVELAMLLRAHPVRKVVVEFYRQVQQSYPATREQLRRIVDNTLQREKRYWKELSATEIAELEAINHSFEETSLSARLRQFVGEHTLIREEQPDLAPLAQELVATPDALAAEWSWLTSGEAGDGWRLGQAIADADTDGKLACVFGGLSVRGRDLRLLSGYVERKRQLLGVKWFDDWLAQELERDSKDMHLLFELTARCGPTEAAVKRLTEALTKFDVPKPLVRLLEFASWDTSIPEDNFYNLLTMMANVGSEEVAAAILAHRLQNGPDGLQDWEPLALKLVDMSTLIRSRHMSGYYWGILARKLLPHHAKEIAGAIFREQADKEDASWAANYSDAEKLLKECAGIDPVGVWNALKPYIATPPDALMFSIGFPREVLDKAPAAEVIAWIGEDPERRAAVVAHMASKDLSNDATLTARVINEFGHIEVVSNSFFSNFISGSWTGPASGHWAELAETVTCVAQRSALPKLRRWAQVAASSLEKMAEQDRRREQEEELRGR
jgi:hypothetical protein